jgi:hypothetical protein
MRLRILAGVLSASCIALTAAACGGSGSDPAAGAAGIVPASVPLYVAVNTDLDGDQITKAHALIDRFPGGEGFLHMMAAQLGKEGVSFERDVKPALGPELDVVLLNVPQQGQDPDVVALLQPADKDKLEALLAKGLEPGEPKPVTREIEGWTAVAENQAVLDRFEQARGDESLEDTDAFKDAMDGLPGDALSHAYVNVEQLAKSALAQSAQQLGSAQLDQAFGQTGLSQLGAAVTAEDDGFRLDATTGAGKNAEDFEPSLPSVLPAGALAYVGIGDVAKGIREALNRAGEQNPQLDQQIAQAELGLGASIDKDVLPLFEQESALAVYPAATGEDEPGIVLALKTDDPQGRMNTIDRILTRIGQFGAPISAPQATQAGGVAAHVVSVSGEYSIYYAALGDKLVITNDPELLAKTNGNGAKLATDPTFRHAQSAADVPGDVQSLIYVNLKAVKPLVAKDAPPQVTENLEPLNSFVLYGSKDDDRVKLSGFLAID